MRGTIQQGGLYSTRGDIKQGEPSSFNKGKKKFFLFMHQEINLLRDDIF
jgi:hypothetical protein